MERTGFFILFDFWLFERKIILIFSEIPRFGLSNEGIRCQSQFNSLIFRGGFYLFCLKILSLIQIRFSSFFYAFRIKFPVLNIYSISI